MATESLDTEDIKRIDLSELKQTKKQIEIDPDDLDFPSMAHHMTVRGKLEALVASDAISYDEMEEVYERWKQSKQ